MGRLTMIAPVHITDPEKPDAVDVLPAAHTALVGAGWHPPTGAPDPSHGEALAHLRLALAGHHEDARVAKAQAQRIPSQRSAYEAVADSLMLRAEELERTIAYLTNPKETR